MKKKCICLLVLSAVLILSSISFAQTYSLQHITTYEALQYDPDMNASGQVAWSEFSTGSPYNVFFWDGHSKTQITNGVYNAYGAWLNDNGQVVWRAGRYNLDIFYWDPAVRNIIQISSAPGIDTEPAINAAGHVAWRGDTIDGSAIHFWDGTNTSIIPDSFLGGYHQFNDNGLLVFTAYLPENVNYPEIFLWDGNETIRITYNNPITDLFPAINGNGHVVWQANTGPDYSREIFLWTGAEPIQLTNNSIDDTRPQINAAGQVVWQGHDGTDQEIYLWDGTGTIQQLTDNSIDDTSPKINSAGQVAWTRGNFGTNRAVFFWDGTNAIQLTDSSSDYKVYELNDNGQMLWDNATAQELYVATPCPGGVCNEPPTAVAGPDQSIRAGDTVLLDGGASFDDNTAPGALVYAWSFSLKPEGSTATLTGGDTATPSFVADVAGTYTVALIVTDEGGLNSAADEVMISSDNLAPTAAAGDDQLVIIGDTVFLDGSASSDPEMDALTFAWAITSAPATSAATLSGAATAMPSFVPDLEGAYEVTLTVSDLIGPGAPDMVLITVASAEDFAETQIVSANDLVDTLMPGQVTTGGNQTAFGNFLSQAVAAIQAGDLATAIEKLQKAIARTDGCVLRGSPDGNGPGKDWITDCVAQTENYEVLNNALDALTP